MSLTRSQASREGACGTLAAPITLHGEIIFGRRMDWLDKLLDTALGGLPGGAAALCPEHIRKRWLERLGDHNPFKTISANEDLVRATRLAWIEAAQEVMKHVHRLGAQHWRTDRNRRAEFEAAVAEALLDARDHALDRRKHVGPSPIDRHVEAVIHGMPELVSPGAHEGLGAGVTEGFALVLAELSGWKPEEVPPIYDHVAKTGLTILGAGPRRSFSELVFAAFAELIKDPKKYPQAREAFHVAIDKLGRDIGQETLAAVSGLDTKLNAALAGLDGLEVLRTGAIQYLALLPDIDVRLGSMDLKLNVLLARDAKLDAFLARMSQEQGVKLETLRAILREMGEEVAADPPRVEQALWTKAAEFRSLRDRLNLHVISDPEVPRLRRAAAKELEAGRFAEADAHLESAEIRDLREAERDLRKARTILAEAKESEARARNKLLSAAESRAQRGEAAMLRVRPEAYREAAQHFGEAARIAESANLHIARGYAVRKGQTLETLGREFGQNEVLAEAIEHFRTMLAVMPRGTEPLHWPTVQYELGMALLTLGERTAVIEHLHQAAQALQEALKEWTQEQFPVEWATTQNSLGNVFLALYNHEAGTEWLHRSIQAYKDALKERPRDRYPHNWAMTLSNLGIAYSTFGCREVGTEWLKQGVQALQEALEEETYERIPPLAWAQARHNFGTALAMLGTRETGTERLEQSVRAFQEALTEWTRERVPILWATTKNNVGNALRTIGERRPGTARLAQAVKAFEEALKEFTRERIPLQWAATQLNLGNALRSLGERQAGTELLAQAVGACDKALKELSRERAPLRWAETQAGLGMALHVLGKREAGSERLERAIQACEDALKEFTREGAPLQWAETQSKLGNVLYTLGEREACTTRLRQAAQAFHRALEVFTDDAAPRYRNTCQADLNRCLKLLHDR